MKPDAQREVRELSERMLQLVCDIPGDPFKHTLEAFGYVVKPKEIFYHSV
jgi:hypothetical protein